MGKSSYLASLGRISCTVGGAQKGETDAVEIFMVSKIESNLYGQLRRATRDFGGWKLQVCKQAISRTWKKKKLNSPEAMQEKKSYIERTIPKFIHQGIKLLICSGNAICGVLSSTGFRGQRKQSSQNSYEIVIKSKGKESQGLSKI